MTSASKMDVRSTCKRALDYYNHASNEELHVFMFVHIRCIFGHASCSLVAMLGNLSRPWTTASDQHEPKQAKQARTYDNITMKPTQASNAKAYTGIYMHEQVIQTTSNSNLDTTGALASALIASATTRVRRLHDMTQSDMQAIRSCMYSYMNACMYVHLQHHVYEDHGSYKQAVFIQVSPPTDVEAMRFAPGTQFYFDAF